MSDRITSTAGAVFTLLATTGLLALTTPIVLVVAFVYLLLRGAL